MKRILSILLVLGMLLTMLSVGAFAADAASTFEDVQNTGTYFYEPVLWAVSNGITSGKTETTFAPNDTCTRAQVVTFLYRVAGEPEVTGSSPFTDVPEDSWCYDAVRWGYQNGIVTGTTETTFAPNKTVSRAQFVTFLWRYAGKPDVSGSAGQFSDVAYGQYYTGAVRWGSLNGIVLGNGAGAFQPNAACTRGQVVTFLYRYIGGTKEPAPEETITVAGKEYDLGQPAAELGTPDEILASTASTGYQWYVYGTADYKNFFAAGVAGGKVVTLLSAGSGFSYQGMQCGSQEGSYSSGSCSVRVYTDCNDSGIVHAVKLTADGYGTQSNYSEEALAGESRLNFHLVNAFRVYHGKKTLKWESRAAEAAALHSQDMAAYNYFDHSSRSDDTRYSNTSFATRMTVLGIGWSTCGENIACSYGGATGTGIGFYDMWVNSAGHRSNMLGSFTYMGVGGGCSAGGSVYFTQDFWG